MIKLSCHCSLIALLLIPVVIGASGCSDSQPLSRRETGAIGGGALGAGLGAIIGNATHNTGAGIAIGAGAGALTGGIIGNELDKRDYPDREEEERIRRQDEEIRRQRREIQELRGTSSDDYYRDTPHDRYDRYDDTYRY